MNTSPLALVHCSNFCQRALSSAAAASEAPAPPGRSGPSRRAALDEPPPRKRKLCKPPVRPSSPPTESPPAAPRVGGASALARPSRGREGRDAEPRRPRRPALQAAGAIDARASGSQAPEALWGFAMASLWRKLYIFSGTPGGYTHFQREGVRRYRFACTPRRS